MRTLRVVARPLFGFSAACFLLAMIACDDSDGSPPASNIVRCDVAPDTGALVERTARCELRDPSGWTIDDPIPDGQARLGRVVGDVRPFRGPEARCGEGDFILQNAHLRVCISGESSNQLWFSGGNIVDLEHPDHANHEFLESAGPTLGISELTGDSIEILNDGSAGDAAVLRVSGVDIMLKFEVGLLANLLGLSEPIGVVHETEYRLGPNAKTLEVVSWVRPEANATLVERQRILGEFLAPGVTATVATFPNGIGRPAPEQTFSLFAAVTEHASYGVAFDEAVNARTPSGSSAVSLLETFKSSFLVLEGRNVSLESDGEVPYRRWYAAGGPNTNDLVAAFDELPGFDMGDRRRVVLRTDDEVAGESAWLVERRADDADEVRWDAVALAWLSDGEATLDLVPGNYRAKTKGWTPERGALTEFVVDGETDVDLPSPNAGYVIARISDANDEPLPAKLRFLGDEPFDHYDIGRRERFPVPAGRWTVEISLGEERTAKTLTDVAVIAGEQIELSATLERTIDTAGWVSGDLHQHANRSFDSNIAAEKRVLTNYTAGVDFFAPSDHDNIEDFAGVVARMGLSEALFVFQGEEITSFTRHMNAFPLTYVHAEPAGGAVPTAERIVGRDPRAVRRLTQVEMADGARARGARIIQLNHARGELPYFDDVGYDPVLGEPTKNEEHWVEDFEVLEVFNHFPAVCMLMRDWSSFLRRGQRVTAVGNSDTHDLVSPSGWPRNYLHIGSDAQQDIDDDALVEALEQGRVTVSGGLFIDFTDGTRPGDVVTIDDGVYDAALRIQSPPWAAAEVLVTYVNGIETSRQTLGSAREDVVDFDGTISVPIEEDAFVFFVAFDSEPMTMVTPGKVAFGMTNAVFIDADGDGYRPPGVVGAADVPLPTALPWCNGG